VGQFFRMKSVSQHPTAVFTDKSIITWLVK